MASEGRKRTVAVIGAGVVGVTSASFLLRKGHAVILLDRGNPGEVLSFCGVDVSKDRLDVVVLPEGWFFSVSNDPAAVFFRPSCRGNFSPYFRRELSLHRGTTLRVRS